MPYTVDHAVKGALLHLQSVSIFFQNEGHLDVASEIWRLSSEIVRAIDSGLTRMDNGANMVENVNDNVGHQTMASSASYAPIQEAMGGLGHSKTVIESSEEDHGHRMMALYAVPCQPSHQQGRQTSSYVIRNYPQSSQAHNHAEAQPGSWAKVAGFITPTSPHKGAQPLTPSSLASLGQSRNGQEVALSSPVSPGEAEIIEEKAGVIRIYGKIERDGIQRFTTSIHEGPIFEIRVETNARTRIVFHQLEHALEFMRSESAMVKRVGHGRFGTGYRVEMAEVVDWGSALRNMCQPIRERRRLSFARKALFVGVLSPEKWRSDIKSLAGVGNIEDLWVFNSGNATAVFISTAVARRVLDTINRWKDCRPAYSGVSVTFSSDPCEKEVNLLKSKNGPKFTKYGQNRRMR